MPHPYTPVCYRTAVNSQSGVRTPAGGIWTGALVILALAVLTPLFYYIPQAALAAVIICAVLDMVDFSLLCQLWKVKSQYTHTGLYSNDNDLSKYSIK